MLELVLKHKQPNFSFNIILFQSKENVQTKQRGPVINGVRRPPRAPPQSPNDCDATVLAEKKGTLIPSKIVIVFIV